MHIGVEPEMLAVERDRRVDIVNDVPDLNRGHLTLSWPRFRKRDDLQPAFTVNLTHIHRKPSTTFVMLITPLSGVNSRAARSIEELRRRNATRFGVQRQPSLRASRSRMMWRRAAPTHFTIQLVQRLADPIQDIEALGCQTVHPGRFRPLGFGGSKPAALGHPRENRIERA